VAEAVLAYRAEKRVTLSLLSRTMNHASGMLRINDIDGRMELENAATLTLAKKLGLVSRRCPNFGEAIWRVSSRGRSFVGCGYTAHCVKAVALYMRVEEARPSGKPLPRHRRPKAHTEATTSREPPSIKLLGARAPLPRLQSPSRHAGDSRQVECSSEHLTRSRASLRPKHFLSGCTENVTLAAYSELLDSL
jgi:hypothetical protein